MKSFMPIQNDTAYEGTLVYSGVWFQVYIQDCRLTENRYLLHPIYSQTHQNLHGLLIPITKNNLHQKKMKQQVGSLMKQHFDTVADVAPVATRVQGVSFKDFGDDSSDSGFEGSIL